jgi:hypothetical protein
LKIVAAVLTFVQKKYFRKILNWWRKFFRFWKILRLKAHFLEVFNATISDIRVKSELWKYVYENTSARSLGSTSFDRKLAIFDSVTALA